MSSNPSTNKKKGKKTPQNLNIDGALVTHACNPSYSGARDQENHGSRPALAKKKPRPYHKITQHKKRAGSVAQKNFKELV
jgi:hypothetical protein